MKRAVLFAVIALLVGAGSAAAVFSLGRSGKVPGLVPPTSAVGDSVADSTAVALADSVAADSIQLADSLAVLRADSAALALETAALVDSVAMADSLAAMEPALPAPVVGGLERERLAKIFASMQPKDAARVLTELDDREIELILTHLRDRQAAAILSNLPPARAAGISQAVLMRTRKTS